VLAAALALGAYLLWPTQVPDDLHLPELDPRRFFSPAELERASDYQRFLRIVTLLSIVVLIAVLGLYARHGARFARESAAGRIGTGMLLGMLGLGLVWLAQFPFGLAELWWERRHDISKQGYVEWTINSWFSLGGEFLAISLAILIVMALARPFRRHWWLPAAPAFAALALLTAFVAPFLIPDLRPLKNERVASDARRLERAQGLPHIPVKVQRVRKLTTAPNAEAAGLGSTRRVILWDTLLDGRFSRRQVRVVVAHELGHHSRRHILEGVAWYGLLAVPGAFLVSLFTRRRGGPYHPEVIPLALFVVVGLQIVSLPVQSVVSRRLEAEADWVALESARDPAATRGVFRKLATTSLAEPEPPEWSHLLFDRHPAIIDRIAMANAWQARRSRATGAHPRQAARR
jgi:Zn-dependent protease with chaperone function